MAAKECFVEYLRSQNGFASANTLESIVESRTTRPTVNRDQYMAFSGRTRAFLSRDNKRYVRSLTEDIEYHLND